MPAINHAVTIPSANGIPNPSGTLTDPDNQFPSSEYPMQCSYPCTVEGHTDSVALLWDGQYFSLSDSESNDPNFGTVAFNYNPPLA